MAKIKDLFDLMRERLHFQAGITAQEAKPSFKPQDLKTLEQTEWSSEFETLMRNRLLMGALRYCTFRKKEFAMKGKWDLLTPIDEKLRLYDETGNLEYLVDIANYCMLAYHFDAHPKRHFYALDDHHSHCKLK